MKQSNKYKIYPLNYLKNIHNLYFLSTMQNRFEFIQPIKNICDVWYKIEIGLKWLRSRSERRIQSAEL